MPKKSFAERRQMVIERRREKERKKARRGPTALQRYEEQGVHWNGEPAQFPSLNNVYDDIFAELDDETRLHAIDLFADHRKETRDQVIRMLGMMSQETGLTPDELLIHHSFSNWHGPQTVSERQRNAAYKAWDTMRARKAAQQS